MEIFGLSEVGYDFEEDDTLENSIWNGKDVRIVKDYHYNPKMQGFQFAPRLIQDSSIINCMERPSGRMRARVIKEREGNTKMETEIEYIDEFSEGKGRIQLRGKGDTDGEVEIELRCEKEF